MRRFLILSVFFSILAFSQLLAAQTKFATYGNARFDYSISYPADLLAPQDEADNADGRAFVGDGARMIVFGTHYIAGGSLHKDFNLSISEFGAKNVTYKIFRKNYFVVSGKKKGKILYQKTMKKPGGAYVTFVIEYDEAKRAVYDKLIPAIAGSFK